MLDQSFHTRAQDVASRYEDRRIFTREHPDLAKAASAFMDELFPPKDEKGYGQPPAKTSAPEPEVPANWTRPVLLKTTITVEFKDFVKGKVKAVARCRTVEEAEEIAREYGPNHYVRISHIYKDASA